MKREALATARRLRVLSTIALTAACGLTGETARAAVDSMPAGHLLRVTLGLIFVLIVMGALAWGLRKGQRLRLASGAGLETLGALSLGAQERVVLIRAGDKHLVLGVAPGRVQTLHVLDEAPQAPADAKAGAPESRFVRSLTDAVARRRTP